MLNKNHRGNQYTNTQNNGRVDGVDKRTKLPDIKTRTGVSSENGQGKAPCRKNYFVKNLAKEAQIENLEKTQLLNPVKEELLEFVFQNIALSRFNYKLIQIESDLQQLKDKNFSISPNYNGIHGLLIFKKIKNQCYSIIIDRKTLSYRREQLKLDEVKIIPVSVNIDDSIYKGTIIDGVMLYNHANGIKNYVINDIYMFRGMNVLNNKICDKMTNITQFLDQNMKDDKNNTVSFIINKLYKLSEINQLIHMYIPASKYNTSIKGLAFYPDISGTKLIYLYNNCAQGGATSNTIQENDNVIKKVQPKEENIKKVQSKDITNNTSSKIEVNVTGSKLLNDENRAILRMKNTGIIDVYQLYAAKKLIKDGRTMIKFKKICIAYLPTIETSKMCRDIFMDGIVDNVLMECEYLTDRLKWIPIKPAVGAKRPDYVENIKYNPDANNSD